MLFVPEVLSREIHAFAKFVKMTMIKSESPPDIRERAERHRNESRERRVEAVPVSLTRIVESFLPLVEIPVFSVFKAPDQSVGKSGAGTLVVKQNIDAVTGATVSTKGVTKGVNAALAAAEAMN